MSGETPVPHPVQPLVRDEKGDLRFKANTIVRHLFNTAKADLNELHCLSFPQEDWDQFNQLLGFTLNDAPVSETLRHAAERMYHEGMSELQARYLCVCAELEAFLHGRGTLQDPPS